MTGSKIHIPVSFELIDTVRKGYDLLDKSIQAEVAGFVSSKQHENGLFTGRDKTPDFYYSLFGAWISEALGLSNSLEKLKLFFVENESKSNLKSSIDSFASILIQHLMFGDNYKKPGFIYLFKFLLGKGIHISIAYRAFFFLLTYDSIYKRKKLVKLLGRIPLFLYNPPPDSPCSLKAAIIILKQAAGMKVKKEANLLFSYYEEGKGFKVFCHLDTADLLSTAVSLFALEKAGADLRLMAPSCIRLVENNYRTGAFISGDGDESKDLEYTFYGLLALGTLNKYPLH